MSEEQEIWAVYMDTSGSRNGRGSLWEVSNFGGTRRNGEDFTPRIGSKGYLKFGVWFVHRAVAELFVYNPDPEHKTEIDHIDGNIHNNKADNLRWVTHQENMNNPITKKRSSAAKKGKTLSEEHKAKMRKPKSEDWKVKMSGRHFYNNGLINVFTVEAPEGFVPGRLKRKKVLLKCKLDLKTN